MLEELFIAAIVGPIVFGAAAWWRFAKLPNEEKPWRKRVALIGLVANSLAIGVPLLQVGVAMVNMNYGITGSIPLSVLLIGGFLLAVITVVAGSLSPKGIRFPLLLAGVLACAFWLILPSGIGIL